jgi:hypothetical protein
MAISAGLISFRYKIEGDNNSLTKRQHFGGKLSFHGVISEDHSTTADLTKFPVQGGFEVSNHAIRRNRKVEIEGIVTNVILPGQIKYLSSKHSPTKYIFKLLNQIVNDSIPCYVTTNLGVYRPVIFKSFKTRQGVGTMDSLNFRLVGEELILAGGLNKSGPKPVEFQIVPEEEYQGLYDKLICNGMEVPEGAVLSKASVSPLESFTIGTNTYLNKGKSLLGVSTLETQNSGIGGVITSENTLGGQPLPSAGAKEFNVGSCLGEATESAVSNAASDLVDSKLGPLEEGLYGLKTDIINMGGDAVAPLLSDGLDCIVAFATDALTENALDECGSPIPNSADGLPSANDVIGGLSDFGKAYTQDLVKISSPF